jgi:hypothetical protein
MIALPLLRAYGALQDLVLRGLFYLLYDSI